MKQKNVILMVVAVGCGLVAAFLTSQMSAKSQVEQIEVVVATKDLPVGTVLNRDDLKASVRMKKVPKDGLPPSFVTNPEDLVDKRLARPVRAEETFNPQDLTKGGVITLPEGYDMVSLQVGVANAAAGFVGPGSRVNVNATLRLGNKLYAFPLLVNMLVVAVDNNTAYTKDGTFPSMNTVSFAVKEKEALLLSLAKSRGCSIELMLRHPTKTSDTDKNYNIDEVLKILQDDQNPGGIKGAVGGDSESGKQGNTQPGESNKKSTDLGTPVTPAIPDAGPAPHFAVVKVLVAKRDIAPHTDVTNDLIAEAFEPREVPKDLVNDALLDFSEALNLQFKTGVAKGQWVTRSMVGLELKPKPQDGFVPPKPGEPVPVNPNLPGSVKPVVRAKIHDVSVHTTHGTVIYRFQEVAPGQWKKIAELTPEQAAKDDRMYRPEEPKAAPDRKMD
jgi:Flp pilus assembly protein CpaB